MKLSEYCTYDALALAALVKKGDVQALELAELSLKAIERLNPELNGVIETFPDQIDAIKADKIPSGPLSGVPFLVKDLVLRLKGRKSEMGSRLSQGMTAPHNTHLAERFIKAGLVTLGRTTTPEMGFCSTTESVFSGPTRNPWDSNLMSGGSSGGSAVMVAAGAVPVAHANDGGGSIRIPSAFCGLVGLKPTRGRTPIGPEAGDGLNGLGIEHVVTRSLRDCAAILDVTEGPAFGDPYAIIRPSAPYLSELDQKCEPLKIGFTSKAWSKVHVDAEISEKSKKVALLCADLGHNVEEASPTFNYDNFREATITFWCANIAAWISHIAEVTGRPTNENKLETTTLACYHYGLTLKATDMLNAFAVMNSVSREVAVFFQKYDVLLTPTTALLPQKIGTYNANDPSFDAHGWTDHIFSFAPFTALFNMTGQPAITLPLSMSATGLPIGTQFAANVGREDVLFRLSSQLEQALPWKDRHPAISLWNNKYSGN
ncbi:MAG: amidase [Emcibacter sp.]|nr:amidase [Emcibacter sp.]